MPFLVFLIVIKKSGACSKINKDGRNLLFSEVKSKPVSSALAVTSTKF
jgi:hypothetical protein